jgi:ABC-type bacteriocin/lantibiotic exporter with double-glycine peptidase domain
VFGGVARLLANVLKTLTSTSVMGLSSTLLLGLVGAAVMYVGARQILAGSLTLGGFFTYTMLLGFLVAPLFQMVSVGTQLTEALAGLERTREVLRESRKTRIAADRGRSAGCAGRSPSRTCGSPTTPGQPSSRACRSARSRAR